MKKSFLAINCIKGLLITTNISVQFPQKRSSNPRERRSIWLDKRAEPLSLHLFPKSEVVRKRLYY